jgi:hypothetical protein
MAALLAWWQTQDVPTQTALALAIIGPALFLIQEYTPWIPGGTTAASALSKKVAAAVLAILAALGSALATGNWSQFVTQAILALIASQATFALSNVGYAAKAKEAASK